MFIDEGKCDIIFKLQGRVNHLIGYITQVNYRFDSEPLFLQRIRGNDLLISPSHSKLRVDISMIGEEFTLDGFDPRISRRVVRDCSIDELLFAIQHKIKDEKPPG